MSRVNNQYSQEYKDRAFDILGKRGFTGHEHILGDWNGTSEIEIINMNGRIYDPRVGQFMQPDNNIQTPEDFIGYDRYAYCRNNPLKYTDPSGEFIFTTLAMFYPPLLPLAIAADIGWMRVVYHPNSDLSSGYTWGLMFQSIVSNSIQAGFTMVIKEMIPTAYILGNENSLFSVGISPSFHFSSNGVAVGGVLSSNFTPLT